MSKNDFFDSRFFVGFDAFKKMIEVTNSAAKSNSNWPPYNIKKIDENKYTIEMAVAGFGKQDIEVEIDGSNLIIKGNYQQGEPAEQSSTGEWTWPSFIYQGLAMRPFTRQFTIADNVEIRGASMLNGILKIVLESVIPENKKLKKVEIDDSEYPSQAAECIAEGKAK